MIQSPLIRTPGGVGLGLSYTMENVCHTITSFSSQVKLQLWATNVTGKFLQQSVPKLHMLLSTTECTDWEEEEGLWRHAECDSTQHHPQAAPPTPRCNAPAGTLLSDKQQQGQHSRNAARKAGPGQHKAL